MDLDIGYVRRTGRTVIVVRGDIDADHGVQVAAAVADEIAEGPTAVSLDLRGVDFVDSSGMRALLRVAADAQRLGRDLEVWPSESLRRLSATMGVDAVLGIGVLG